MRAPVCFSSGRGGPTMCPSCGHFISWDGEGCLYCDQNEDDSFSWEDWEVSSEPEEEEEKPQQRTSPATFCGFKKSFLCHASGAPPPARKSQDCSLPSLVLPLKQQLTAEEAERNAEELVAEEERAKKKAEKKRLKKKRQKDRKRQEKHNQEVESQAGAAEASGRKQGAPSADVLRPRPPEPEDLTPQGPSQSLMPPDCSTEEELEEELDLTSTFVSKARLKVSTKSPQRKEKVEKGKTAQPERTEPLEANSKAGLQKNPVEQSMVLADCGNATAQRGCYREAVLLFTEAVKLNPREYRFFGNRSFCFEKLQCYPEALRDAQLALRLQPGWPKGLFRQGKALMGLQPPSIHTMPTEVGAGSDQNKWVETNAEEIPAKHPEEVPDRAVPQWNRLPLEVQYADAARTFEELLRIDGFQDDAATQLRRCHVHLLLNNLAPPAAPLPAWNGLVQGTQLPLPGGRPLASCSSPQGGMSLASVSITRLKLPPVPPSAAQAPVNREWFAVWVGNLTPKITQETLLRYFQPFGPIDSIRCLPQKFCAFINYTRRDSAEAAFKALQGVEVEGRRLQLQLKHPLHATPPFAKASHSSAQQQPPVKREQAPLAATGFPKLNSSRVKGDRSSFGPLPQRGASAKKLQQL